jgi:hypothetical protein
VRVEALLSRIKIHSNFGFIFSANFNSRGERGRERERELDFKYKVCHSLDPNGTVVNN